MKFNKILFTAMLAAGCLTASAQEAAVDSLDVMVPHAYVQGQIGAQYTLGERKFGALISGNAQVAVGYQFTPLWGARFGLGFWQSKGGSSFTSTGTLAPEKYGWKYNYVAPAIDATLDLTNLIGGEKNRGWDVGLLAGLGLNIAWNNDEAQQENATMTMHRGVPGPNKQWLEYLWSGTKARLTGRFGAYADYRVCNRLDVNFELNCNVLNDHYSSKKAGNADWYFNALVGVKYHLGKTTRRIAAKEKYPCGEIIVEKIVEKPVEKVVEKIIYKEPEVTEEVAPATLRRDIFFLIRGSVISKTEMAKVDDIVEFMNEHPATKVVITGYADKGTGSAQVNYNYARKRAQAVADILKSRGIAASRVTVDSKGDTEQPYEKNELNRVSICIVE